MNSTHKQRLVELGAERLADALLDLADRDGGADDLVERMIATPQKNIERFKQKLAGIKRSRRFIRWGDSAAFARELQGLLQDVQEGVSGPRTGVELIAAFYEREPAGSGTCGVRIDFWTFVSGPGIGPGVQDANLKLPKY